MNTNNESPKTKDQKALFMLLIRDDDDNFKEMRGFVYSYTPTGKGYARVDNHPMALAIEKEIDPKFGEVHYFTDGFEGNDWIFSGFTTSEVNLNDIGSVAAICKEYYEKHGFKCEAVQTLSELKKYYPELKKDLDQFTF